MIRHMTTGKLERWLEAGETDAGSRFVLVNVLGPEAFREERIPGSRNVPVTRDDLVERVDRLAGGRDLPVVVYCASEDCDASPRAAGRLASAGYSAVYDYSGGLRAWTASGRAVESGPARASRD